MAGLPTPQTSPQARPTRQLMFDTVNDADFFEGLVDANEFSMVCHHFSAADLRYGLGLARDILRERLIKENRNLLANEDVEMGSSKFRNENEKMLHALPGRVQAMMGGDGDEDQMAVAIYELMEDEQMAKAKTWLALRSLPELDVLDAAGGKFVAWVGNKCVNGRVEFRSM